jgi:hypothetical protein
MALRRDNHKLVVYSREIPLISDMITNCVSPGVNQTWRYALSSSGNGMSNIIYIRNDIAWHSQVALDLVYTLTFCPLLYRSCMY